MQDVSIRCACNGLHNGQNAEKAKPYRSPGTCREAPGLGRHVVAPTTTSTDESQVPNLTHHRLPKALNHAEIRLWLMGSRCGAVRATAVRRVVIPDIMAV